jgi:anti-sigma factor RsiW
MMAELACQDFVELVTEYLEGALDEDTATRFEEHLALCQGCETYLDQMNETASRLGEIPVESLSDEMQSTLLSAFRNFHR